MTQSKKWFHIGLWKEGMKQLRLIGFLSMLILALCAVLPPVGAALALQKNNFDPSIRTMDYTDNLAIFLIFCIAAPLMMLTLFHFLNKRNASDCYHAMPHTRICLYISYLTAVLTWVVVLTLVSGGLFMLTCACLHQNFVLLYASVWQSMLYVFVASFLVVSAIGIAMSITGTIFTNLILSGLILFLPRIAILLICNGISNAPMMVTTDLPFLLQSTCNLVINLIFMAFTNSGLLIGSQFYWSVLYTAGLALLYLILGTFLFQKRKSETAGQSAPNRRLQAVYRIILVMAYCLPVCVWIVDSEVTSISGFEVFVLYLIAVLIYFFYELLTTKKIKQTLRTAPGLLLVAACNGVLIFGMHTAYQKELQFAPSAEEIQSVFILGDGLSSAAEGNFINFSSYADYRSGEIQLKGEDARQLVAASLYDCVQTYQKNPDQYWEHYHAFGDMEKSGYRSYNVKIQTAHHTKYRNIFVPAEQNAILENAILQNPQIEQIWKTMPEPVPGTLSVENFSSDQAAELYDSVQKELQTISFSTWYEHCNFGNPSTENDPSFALECTVRLDGKIYQFYFDVASSLFPDTYQKYCQMRYEEDADSIQELQRIVSHLSDSTSGNFYLDLYNSKGENYYLSGDFVGENGAESLKAVCSRIQDQPCTAGAAYANLFVYFDDSYTNYSLMVSIKDFQESDLSDQFSHMIHTDTLDSVQ